METTNKKVSVLNVILILNTLVATGFAGYLWLQSQARNMANTQLEPEVLSPVFLTLKPFTISLPPSEDNLETNKILYVGIVLRVADKEQKNILLDLSLIHI